MERKGIKNRIRWMRHGLLTTNKLIGAKQLVGDIAVIDYLGGREILTSSEAITYDNAKLFIQENMIGVNQ